MLKINILLSYLLVHKDLYKLAEDVCNDFIKNRTECDGMIRLMGSVAVNSFIKHTFDY